MILEHFEEYKKELQSAFDSIDKTTLTTFYSMIRCYQDNGAIYVCGNGGSAAIAEHFACDHNKGVRQNTNLHPHVISLSSNLPLITAIGNDISFDDIFSEQIKYINVPYEAEYENPPMVIVISSSGNSPNIIKALKAAKDREFYSMAIVGFDGGKVLSEELSDCTIHIKSSNYGIVEDCSQSLMHILAQALRLEHTTDQIKVL